MTFKQLRERAGLSQAQAAKQIGCSKRTIEAYDQGRRDIRKCTGETLLRISEVLGCTIDELIEKN